MGPHFDRAATRIGRKRLPPGIVAMHDDPELLRAGIRELHEYATTSREPSRPRRGIVFRVVEAWEQHAVMQKVCDFFGPKLLASYHETFSVPAGHLHILDDSIVSHAHNRHGTVEGSSKSLLALKLEDFLRVPEVVDPRHIVEFSITKKMPRIVYERDYENFVLVVIEEIRLNAGVVAKTAYRRAK